MTSRELANSIISEHGKAQIKAAKLNAEICAPSPAPKATELSPTARDAVTHELLAALKLLLAATDYVSPIVGAVATEAKVSHIRQAGKFMKARDVARDAIAKAER